MPKRSEIRFNENTVKTNKPKEKRYEIWDKGYSGLFLRVLPTGTKSFFIALDRRTIRKIGDANLLTVGQAKTRATKMKADFDEGKNWASESAASLHALLTNSRLTNYFINESYGT